MPTALIWVQIWELEEKWSTNHAYSARSMGGFLMVKLAGVLVNI